METKSVKLTLADTLVFSGWYLFLSSGLAECWNTQALLLGLSRVCTPMRHRQPRGLLDFLPEMISSSGENSSVVWASRATAQAFLTSRCPASEVLSTERALAYDRALAATNGALQDPLLRIRDDTLACVWLLSLYEVRALRSLLRINMPQSKLISYIDHFRIL